MRWLNDEQIMSRVRWSIFEKVYSETKINFCLIYLAEKLHLTEHFNDKRLLKRKERIHHWVYNPGHGVLDL